MAETYLGVLTNISLGYIHFALTELFTILYVVEDVQSFRLFLFIEIQTCRVEKQLIIAPVSIRTSSQLFPHSILPGVYAPDFGVC